MGRRGVRDVSVKLHVLTAVTRTHNLPAIADSIVAAQKLAPDVDIAWHCRFDPQRLHVGGQALKNRMLDDITDGWVVILDDDTVMHKLFLRVIYATFQPDTMALVVSQKRTTGQVLVAAPENVVVGGIDAGQAVLRRDLIGDHRLPASYAGDGVFLQTLLAGRSDVVFVNKVLSLHNMLSGIDVSETPERMRA